MKNWKKLEQLLGKVRKIKMYKKNSKIIFLELRKTLAKFDGSFNTN